MSQERVGIQGGDSRVRTLAAARSEFERDWDRIVFSRAFRRLHDKTQVFPLPGANDVVHSRLTHSLEVACVGRMLGALVGQEICKGNTEGALTPHDLSCVVASAALAHDVGNAPLGHAGEISIRGFFQALGTLPPDNLGNKRSAQLDAREMADLQSFDGNPQGFRLLTRLEQEKAGGMQLTAATLAAFSKYPWPSTDSRASTSKGLKFGFYRADQSLFTAVANATGLVQRNDGWCRHPLALLVEAADDICYSILDIEDGVRLGIVPENEAVSILTKAAANDSESGTPRDLVQFRANAVEGLVLRVRDVFIQNYAAIMDGSFEGSLTKELPGIRELKKLAFENCYSSPEVLELEIAGDEAIRGLLGAFAHAVLAQDEKLAAFRLLKARKVQLEPAANDYERLLRVIDYVGGMTDGYVFETYRRLAGIDLGGRAA